MKKTLQKQQLTHYCNSCLSVLLLLILMLAPAIGWTDSEAAPVPGDIDGNELIELADAVAGLKVLAGIQVSPIQKQADVNGDDKIGIEEVVYDLQFIAGFMTGLTNSALSDLANTNTLAVAHAEKNIKGLEQMSDVLAHIGLDKAQTKRRSNQGIVSYLLNSDFPCGTVEKEGLLPPTTLIYTFNGAEDCGGVTGKLKITPYLSSEAIIYSLVYEDVKAGDCVINGIANAKISAGNNLVTAEYNFNDMVICGQNMDGTASISFDTAGQTISASGSCQNIYSADSSEITVGLDYSYSATDGINGFAIITMNGETYNCEFKNIKTDPDCQMPVGGSLTFNDITVDFNDTSCTDPLADVTLNDLKFNVSLEQAKNTLNIVGPTPRNARLKAADTCENLLNEFKEKTVKKMEEELDENLKRYIEWGGCRWWYLEKYNDIPMIDAGESPPSGEGAEEYSETNTQVEGVDEADFVKNDASHIYILADGKFQIIKAWPPEESSVISSLEIEGTPKKMFVHNNSAFIYSSLDYIRPDDYNPYEDYYYEPQDNECTYGYGCDFTGDGRQLKITVLDISNMAEPAMKRELYFSGSYLNSRRIGDAVHSVLVFPEPQIKGIEYWPNELNCDCYYYWDCYPEEQPDYTEEQLTAMFEVLKAKNRDVIMNSDITAWLPSVKDVRYVGGQPQAEEKLLGDCDDYYVSLQGDGDNFLSMVSTDVTGNEAFHTTSIVGRPGAVYASSSAFYISSRHQQYGMYWYFDAEEEIEEASTIHKFTLKNDPPSSAYKGSGVVKGKVLNQFSMDEYNGFLRIATTTGHVPNPNVHSTISVLRDNGSELDVVGQIDGIAPTEDIRSARFDGNRGYIVTFKKTDPLFVFNLSDPYNPVVAGELKIPGFSTYMHRMDEDHLLSIGYDAEDMGSYALFQGIMLQIFDVSDMTKPELIHKEVIGTRGSTSDAATNHLAFNYFKPRELLAIPMIICEEQGGSNGSYGAMMTFSGLMVYNVTSETGFEYIGGVPHEEPETENGYRNSCSNWWTNSNSQVKRSIFMDDYVFSITEDEIKVHLVSNLGTDISLIRLTGR
ncbi:MAG: hypothetical protein GY795_30995 [Desulfobacterales bacterium]|nr:hypothetical protein [Desulfobacterales bacterium]